MFTNENQVKDHIQKNSYLVIFPDKKIELFSSLRNIQDAISVDSSTISKKLKEQDYNYFKAKGSEYVFFIHKLNP
jgi:hypothetical protein|tara:strand:- start:161 stop:385 length:225 start_codon:yes stop_codon:yes gene_type:complete